MKKNKFMKVIVSIIIVLIIYKCVFSSDNSIVNMISGNNSFYLLSNPDNKEYMDKLVSYAKENHIKLKVSYADDLEAIDLLEDGNKYDGVWLSNSTWLYMLNDVSVSDSKSISINPVVMGVKKSKAEKLGFVGTNIYNKNIMKAIKDGELKYIMTSVTKTNSGLTAYLGFLNSLAGSPEILTSSMLNNKELKENMVSLFSGVERVSGSDSFLEDMFIKSDEYEAVIASESSLLNINKQLEDLGREPLYLLYPVDGVAINDSPFGYIDRGEDNKEKFDILQSYLLSLEVQKDLEKYGKRTWYGGINENADQNVFKLSWGVDTTKYLMPQKYPSKNVINKALNLYIDEFRKPTSLVFCLDYSGSMYGDGQEQLVDAMKYILDYNEASKEYLQFSEKDRIGIIPFSSHNLGYLSTDNGRNTNELINRIELEEPGGGTNIYDCAIEALEKLSNVSDDYTKTVILMTDGQSNTGSYSSLSNYYSKNNLNIPIYSIMFGNSDEDQLQTIANLTNAKVFDGKNNLISAFKEVRSYN